LAKKSLEEFDLSSEEKTGGVTTAKNILMRIVAVFAASGLSVIGAGAIVGIDTLHAVILAGTLGVATVVERLARGFLNDGKLDEDEINQAFAAVDKKAN
jgi:hypothetical protein